MAIEFALNGATQRVEPRPGETFLETLRERCGITSLKDGCSPHGQCGCCAALLAERFGGTTPSPRATPGLDLDAIRAQALAQAARLWSRMADL